MAVSRLAVTVLCGLNHAGKTALRQQLLEHHEGRRMALLTEEARCSGSNLHRQVVRLAAQRCFDHLIVEASPAADPRALAALFPHEHARLDCVVTCIAAETFLGDLQSEDPVADCDHVTGQLLASQVEFSNVLTLSHTDRLDGHQNERLRQILCQLNPIARIEDASQTPVPLAALLPTGLYESQKFALSSGWPCIAGTSPLAAPDGSSQTARLVFRSHRPFHPQRFWDRLQRGWPGVLRAKGFCWLAPALITSAPSPMPAGAASSNPMPAGSLSSHPTSGLTTNATSPLSPKPGTNPTATACSTSPSRASISPVSNSFVN